MAKRKKKSAQEELEELIDGMSEDGKNTVRKYAKIENNMITFLPEMADNLNKADLQYLMGKTEHQKDAQVIKLRDDVSPEIFEKGKWLLTTKKGMKEWERLITLNTFCIARKFIDGQETMSEDTFNKEVDKLYTHLSNTTGIWKSEIASVLNTNVSMALATYSFNHSFYQQMVDFLNEQPEMR